MIEVCDLIFKKYAAQMLARIKLHKEKYENFEELFELTKNMLQRCKYLSKPGSKTRTKFNDVWKFKSIKQYSTMITKIIPSKY